MISLDELEVRLKNLEDRYRILKDTEAILTLKCYYWYSIDNQLWDEVGNCFAEDAGVDYGFGIQLRGKKLITRFFKRIVGPHFAVSAHQGHNPKIEFISDTTARGRWQLDQFGIESQTQKAVRIGTTYYDEYIKQDGSWKIKSTRETYHYQEVLNLAEIKIQAKDSLESEGVS